jgi:hypothetical protein
MLGNSVNQKDVLIKFMYFICLWVYVCNRKANQYDKYGKIFIPGWVDSLKETMYYIFAYKICGLKILKHQLIVHIKHIIHIYIYIYIYIRIS